MTIWSLLYVHKQLKKNRFAYLIWLRLKNKTKQTNKQTEQQQTNLSYKAQDVKVVDGEKRKKIVCITSSFGKTIKQGAITLTHNYFTSGFSSC